MRTIAFAAAAVLALGLLAGCGEREPVMEGKRSYQGKRDTNAWDNAPLAYGNAKWNKGDQASWQSQIKERQAAQNEYNRIGR